MTSTSTHGMRSTGSDADLMRQAQAKALHMQNGGPVNGPGTSTSDSIPAKLSKGEYVIPAHIVAQKGTDFFDKMIDPETKKPGGMKATMKDGEVHAWDGGLVGNTAMKQQSDDIIRAFQSPSIKEQGGFNIGRGTATPVATPATPVATPFAMSHTVSPTDPTLAQMAGSQASDNVPPPPGPANRLDLGGGNYIQGKMAPGADVEHMRSLMAPSTPEAAAGRAASEAEVDKRRAATAAWDRANPQAPAGGMSYQPQALQQTDYTGAINQLLEQASTAGVPNSFDSMIAAKHQRQAAQQGLQTLSGMRSADLSNQQGYARMASEQGMKQQDLAAAQANREAERGIAVGTAAQAQADRDRAFGLSYDTAAESQRHTGAMEAGQAEDRAFRVGQQQSSDAKALQEEKARQAKIAGATGYAESQEMATFNPKTGTYSKPGVLYGTNPLDAAATSRIKAVKSGQDIADIYGRLKSR